MCLTQPTGPDQVAPPPLPIAPDLPPLASHAASPCSAASLRPERASPSPASTPRALLSQGVPRSPRASASAWPPARPLSIERRLCLAARCLARNRLAARLPFPEHPLSSLARSASSRVHLAWPPPPRSPAPPRCRVPSPSRSTDAASISPSPMRLFLPSCPSPLPAPLLSLSALSLPSSSPPRLGAALSLLRRLLPLAAPPAAATFPRSRAVDLAFGCRSLLLRLLRAQAQPTGPAEPPLAHLQPTLAQPPELLLLLLLRLSVSLLCCCVAATAVTPRVFRRAAAKDPVVHREDRRPTNPEDEAMNDYDHDD
ncbi:hypothetical protein BRADI_1g43291v3 [Brachypodium distachyon]|uniref:Uncharacterized protein n=1 Tax=Brachypodium distachyon TaxID=15368 RepID=A0A2K2DP43_BRADI|nr:hypothetical protein BRADI_1g43291v3 [Brachypodium distachyon]